METNDDLKLETEHVKYWDECLKSLAKQFEILYNSIQTNVNYQEKRNSFIEQKKTKFKTELKLYKKEPSHLYFLSEVFFDFYSCLRDSMNPNTKKTISQVNNSIKEIIQQIIQAKNETCKSTLRLIKKCKVLIANIKEQENEYQKAKTSLDDAQVYQKKVKNVDKYTYNVTKKEKADFLLSEKIKEMEKIKKPLEDNKKLLSDYRVKLKSSLRDNFELIVSTSFKHLANYYQCIFLLLNNKYEVLTRLKEKIDDILTQLSNLVFDLNDYSEKKFGETNLGIKTEGIPMCISDELNKASMKKLIDISNNVINYVKIFLLCLRYRKKIMKIFYELLNEINKYEIEFNKEFDNNKKSLLTQIDSLKNINYYSQKNWRIILAKEKISQIAESLNELAPIINNYIEFVRNEHKTFLNNWEDLEEKLKERKKLSINFINEINTARMNNKVINKKEFSERNEKKICKLKEAIKNAVDFIQINVPTTREKDKNEMLKLESTFEKFFLNYQNANNQLIVSTENDINNSANTDIFEECKVLIIKYFNRFRIQNYDSFLEKMKMKLLVNTNLSEEKLGQGVIRKLSMSNNDEIKFSNSVINFEESESALPLDNKYTFGRTRAQSTFVKFKNKGPFNLGNNILPNNNDNNLNISNTNNNSLNKSLNNSNIINSSINKNISDKNISKSTNNNFQKKVNIINKSINNNLNNSINRTINKDINSNNLNQSINKNKNNTLNNSINKNINKSINNNINNNNNNNNKSKILNNNTLTNIKINEEEDEDEELNNISSHEIINELENEDNLELMNENQFTRYTEMKDPYSNIKEEELNRLLNLKDEDTCTKNEIGEGEEKIDSFSCSISDQMISRGNLLVTTKKIEFYSSIFKKVQIIIPLKDIVSIKKKSYLGIDTAIQINTEKVSHLFTSFLSRDYCYSLLNNEINRVKNETKNEKDNNNEEEKVDMNSPEQKYLGKKRFKAKQISKMLEEINFYKKLKEITQERMELFTKQYTDEKKGFFVPQNIMKRKYAEVVFNDCPLFIPFTILCKMTTQLEEYKRDKGFFESLFLDRGDTEVKFSENPEFSNTIPDYFNNADYVMNLFSQFNKEDFENFLNEIQNWSHKYEYNCHAIHKVKKVPFGPPQVVMKDRFIVYFISPTLLIFDDMAYATEFTYCDNFLPLFRYRFDCDIKFNDFKGKFEFNTKMTISYITIFLVNFMLKSAVESKSNNDTEELIKGEIIDKLKDSLNLYVDRFKDIFERVTDETFQRKIDLKQNMITGEIEEEVIEGIMEEEKPPEENNNNNNENTDKKEEENVNNENGGIHQQINEFIDKNKNFIFIGIIAIIIIGILISFFNSSKGKRSLIIDTIFNLMILGAIFYLFKFK